MTIAEAERFYERDAKKYEVSKNEELLVWLNKIVENGYHSYTSVEILQELIDNIVYWYEMKYTEREMEFYEGTRYFDFEDITALSKYMNIKQLMYRLPHEQLSLIECDYRAKGGGIRTVYNDKKEVIGNKTVLFISINRKKHKYNCMDYFLLYGDSKDGKVHIDSEIKDIVNKDDITLDELLVLFKKKCSKALEFSELEQCIYDHNCDVELRRRILQLVALKLLYSKNTIPERGYERAKRFINEFNKKLGLNISSEEIDEIIAKDYTKDENIVMKSNRIFKTILKNK